MTHDPGIRRNFGLCNPCGGRASSVRISLQDSTKPGSHYSSTWSFFVSNIIDSIILLIVAAVCFLQEPHSHLSCEGERVRDLAAPITLSLRSTHARKQRTGARVPRRGVPSPIVVHTGWSAGTRGKERGKGRRPLFILYIRLKLKKYIL